MNDTNALIPLNDTMQLGKVLAESGFFQDSPGASKAVVKVLAGRELGIGPVASMTGINIIQGRVTLSANLIAALVKRSGRYNYQVMALDDDHCTIRFFEQGKPIGDSTFTVADARKAGTKNMDKFPRNMLFARAMSNGAKWFCADISAGPIYTPEELGADVNEDGEVITSTARIVEPAPAQPDSRPTPAPAPDPEWEAMGANGQPASAAKPAPDAKPPKVAVIKTKRFFDLAPAFAAAHDLWQGKNGAPDTGHICASAAKLGFAEITETNVDAVFSKLEAHALSKEASAGRQAAA